MAVLAETGASGQFDQEEVALGYSNRLTEDVTCCDRDDEIFTLPGGSMYGLFTYIFAKKNTEMYPNVGIEYTYHTLYMDPLDIGRGTPESAIWSNHQSDCMKHVLTWWRTKARARGIQDVWINVYHHLFVSWCLHAQRADRDLPVPYRERESV